MDDIKICVKNKSKKKKKIESILQVNRIYSLRNKNGIWC